MTDIISCKAFEYNVELGFHENEKGSTQKVVVDIEAYVNPINDNERDNINAIQFDYFKANQLLQKKLSQKKFNLIETLSEEIANILLNAFNIKAVRIKLTKKLVKIDNVDCVSYKCFRQKKHENYK